jgi:hypothetical protein
MKHYSEYKKAKRAMIKKYLGKKKYELSRQTQNKEEQDMFISINHFLATDYSRGQHAEPGYIDYDYQNYLNIYNFFYILTKYYGFEKIVCKPKFVLKYKNYIMNSACVILFDKNEMVIPADLKNTIRDCMAKDNIRFIYSIFVIDSSENQGASHANMMVIDLFRKTVERFEPYGKYMVNNTFGKNITKSIDEIIRRQFMELAGLNDFTYLSPVDLEPLIGPQSVGDLFGGMCVTFSMIYLHLRIMNPDIKSENIVAYLSKMTKHRITVLISKYARFIEDTLKSHPQDIEHNYKKLEEAWNNKQEYYIVSFHRRERVWRRIKGKNYLVK